MLISGCPTYGLMYIGFCMLDFRIFGLMDLWFLDVNSALGICWLRICGCMTFGVEIYKFSISGFMDFGVGHFGISGFGMIIAFCNFVGLVGGTRGRRPGQMAK